jgi:hypothetical protein
MATQLEINAYRARIFTQARKGTPVNPRGVPIAVANFLATQAMHESGKFTSNAFVKHNNLFGYTYSGSRYQTGPGLIADNGKPVAAYATLEDSVKELVDWLYRRVRDGKFPPLDTFRDTDQDLERYAELLKAAGYYGDSLQNYYAGLKRFFQKITPGAGSVGVGLLFAGAAICYIYRRDLFPGL